MNNEESINDALKRLQLGQHESKSPEQALMDKIHAVNLRVAELCRQTWKDRSPTKAEFAQLVGQTYQYELGKSLTREEREHYLAALCMETAFKAIYD